MLGSKWDTIVANFFRASFEVSARGGTSLGVTLQDQTTDMLDLLFLQEKVTGLELASDTSVESRDITLAPLHGLTTANSKGHIIEIASTVTGRFTQNVIITVTSDVVNTDRAVGQAFEVADTVIQTGNPNMVKDTATNVVIDGSVTPVIFTVKPLATQSGDITRVLMAATSPNASDLTTFGGAPALVLGVNLRKKRSDGTFKNLFNYKTNFDNAMHGFDTKQYDPRGGNTTKGFGGRVTFAGQPKHGVAERLDGALAEELQIVISELMDDSATGNLTVSFIAEGSELQGD